MLLSSRRELLLMGAQTTPQWVVVVSLIPCCSQQGCACPWWWWVGLSPMSPVSCWGSFGSSWTPVGASPLPGHVEITPRHLTVVMPLRTEDGASGRRGKALSGNWRCPSLGSGTRLAPTATLGMAGWGSSASCGLADSWHRARPQTSGHPMGAWPHVELGHAPAVRGHRPAAGP